MLLLRVEGERQLWEGERKRSAKHTAMSDDDDDEGRGTTLTRNHCRESTVTIVILTFSVVTTKVKCIDWKSDDEYREARRLS
jgi:hypothetical protein